MKYRTYIDFPCILMNEGFNQDFIIVENEVINITTITNGKAYAQTIHGSIRFDDSFIRQKMKYIPENILY